MSSDMGYISDSQKRRKNHLVRSEKSNKGKIFRTLLDCPLHREITHYPPTPTPRLECPFRLVYHPHLPLSMSRTGFLRKNCAWRRGYQRRKTCVYVCLLAYCWLAHPSDCKLHVDKHQIDLFTLFTQYLTHSEYSINTY